MEHVFGPAATPSFNRASRQPKDVVTGHRSAPGARTVKALNHAAREGNYVRPVSVRQAAIINIDTERLAF